MAQASDHPLDPMVRKLGLWSELDSADQAEIKSLPYQLRQLDAGQYLVWDGDKPQNCALLLSGFAYRHKHAGNGGRQVLSIHMKGDLIDLQNSLLGVADHNVQMLAAGDLALIPIAAIRELAARNPAVGMAMWYETLVEASIFREWVSTSAAAMPAPGSRICYANSRFEWRWPSWASRPITNCRSPRSSWPMRSR
jgi:CRP-like cAMP-binding protein